MLIGQRLRALRLATIVSLKIICLSSCASTNEEVEIPRPPISLYSVQPDDSICPVNPESHEKEAWCKDKPGLYRPVGKKVLTFEEARNFISIDPKEFSRILEKCPK